VTGGGLLNCLPGLGLRCVGALFLCGWLGCIMRRSRIGLLRSSLCLFRGGVGLLSKVPVGGGLVAQFLAPLSEMHSRG
jgi:hypothetical protein